MEINQKLLKPITEVSYLRAENVDRYRVIIRYLFIEDTKLNSMVYRDDVYKMMKETGLFEDYTEEHCQSDLNALEEWGNITSDQDLSKVETLKEFKNKKYRYQLSRYTIEIERMTQRLEEMEIEGASLEPTLLQRIRENIEKIDDMLTASSDVVFSWWDSIYDDFNKLNRSYQDYTRDLNGIHSEEMLKSDRFVIYKEKITRHLRTFVKSLQEEGLILESFIKDIDPQKIDIMISKVIEHRNSFQLHNENYDENEYRAILEGRWQSIYRWFVPTSVDSEINRMSDSTLEIIRKITRYAQQIGEFYHQGSNRKEEYRHLMQIFSTCESVEDAHRLSAMIFGVEKPFHLKNLKPRDTDSIQSAVFDEAPTFYELEARARIRVEKKDRVPAFNYELERRMRMQEIIDQENRNKRIIETYMVDNVIEFNDLPTIDQHTRKTLLNWLSRALADKDLKSRTEWGQYFTASKSSDNICVLKCEDGDLEMPSYRLIFERGAL